MPSLARVDNKIRFLWAVQYTYSLLNEDGPPDQGDTNQLIADIAQAIGQRDNNNLLSKNRIKEYKRLIKDLKEYNEYEWFNKAVEEKQFTVDNPYAPMYVWKAGYETSDWYQFQMAVKEHQKLVVDDILKPIFAKMEAII